MAQQNRTPRSVTVLPMQATYAELEQLVNLTKKAFGPNPFYEHCFTSPDVPQLSVNDRVQRHMDRIVDPKWVFHKAVDASDPSGPTLGASLWYWAEDPQKEALNSPGGDWPAGSRTDCLDALFGSLRRWRHKHFSESNQPYFYLVGLYVLPETQGRGVGGALLREGLKEADRKGWPTFLEASSAGLGLYKKIGWEEAAKSAVNLKDFGGKDFTETVVAMIRPPRAKEQTEASS